MRSPDLTGAERLAANLNLGLIGNCQVASLVDPNGTHVWTCLPLDGGTGAKRQARELFEQMLRCRNQLGLMSEDLAPDGSELWGNFPQTYSMVGIITGAMRLSPQWEDAL